MAVASGRLLPLLLLLLHHVSLFCSASALPPHAPSFSSSSRFHRVARQNNDAAPTVDLGYATYRGIRHEESGVDEYLGMRYAQPPLGALRFRAPQDPLPEAEIQDATSVSDLPPMHDAVNEETSQQETTTDDFHKKIS